MRQSRPPPATPASCWSPASSCRATCPAPRCTCSGCASTAGTTHPLSELERFRRGRIERADEDGRGARAPRRADRVGSRAGDRRRGVDGPAARRARAARTWPRPDLRGGVRPLPRPQRAGLRRAPDASPRPRRSGSSATPAGCPSSRTPRSRTTTSVATELAGAGLFGMEVYYKRTPRSSSRAARACRPARAVRARGLGLPRHRPQDEREPGDIPLPDDVVTAFQPPARAGCACPHPDTRRHDLGATSRRGVRVRASAIPDVETARCGAAIRRSARAAWCSRRGHPLPRLRASCAAP